MTAHAVTLTDVTVVTDRRWMRPARRILDGVSLAVLPGEVTGIAGPRWSGKSVLLRVAAGRMLPATGTARVCGVRASDPGARRVAGYAPEAPVFPAALTVREVLAYCARLHAAGATGRVLVRDALDLAGLQPVADRRVAALGRADVQRLSLAQAILGGRHVLVLDETLSGLDAAARRDLCARLAHLAATGVAVLLAARDLTVLERLAARVLVLRGGRVARAGPVTALAGERVLEVILDAPPPDPPPGFRVVPAGLEAPLAGRTAEAALALCHAHRLPVRASRVRVKSLEDVVLDGEAGAR